MTRKRSVLRQNVQYESSAYTCICNFVVQEEYLLTKITSGRMSASNKIYHKNRMQNGGSEI